MKEFFWWLFWLTLFNLFNVTRAEITTNWQNTIKKYSPIVWIDEQESYFPGKIEDFLPNVKPIVGGTSNEIAPGAPDPLTIYNLNFTTTEPTNIFLTSNDDPAANPQASWMFGIQPSENESPPIHAIFVDKGVNGEGKVQADVFYFFWYPFNLGSEVVSEHFGNHVGDWEYMAIRFEDYLPTQVFTSQHSNGKLYSPNLIEKTADDRYVVYSARGTHANYIRAGTHCLVLGCLVEDFTSQGTMWETLKSLQIVEYDTITKMFSSGQNPDPLAWLNFQGNWGDQAFPDNDPRQKDIGGFKKWTEGPTGPIVKDLNRKNLCQVQDDCTLIDKCDDDKC